LKDNESPDTTGKESMFAWGSNTKRDSSVGVVTRLEAGWLTNLGSIQGSGKKRFSPQHPNWLWNATRLPMALYPAVERPVREANNLPLPNAEVMNAWCRNSTPPQVEWLAA
jgi:hypothetical protein